MSIINEDNYTTLINNGQILFVYNRNGYLIVLHSNKQEQNKEEEKET